MLYCMYLSFVINTGSLYNETSRCRIEKKNFRRRSVRVVLSRGRLFFEYKDSPDRGGNQSVATTRGSRVNYGPVQMCFVVCIGMRVVAVRARVAVVPAVEHELRVPGRAEGRDGGRRLPWHQGMIIFGYAS